MIFEKECEIDVTVEEIISEMSARDKKEMYEELKAELTGDIGKEFGNMMPSDQKRFLCDALGVPSYYDNECLRTKLQTIIEAI